MTSRFLITGILTSVVNLILHAAAYILFLKNIFRAHPPLSEEFSKQLSRPQLVIWAMFITSLTMGFFITLIMKWSPAKNFKSGLKYGSIAGYLFWASVNFGLYASSNYFSAFSVFIDFLCSGTVMMLACAFSAWILNRKSN